jgi:hypothetical protein
MCRHAHRIVFGVVVGGLLLAAAPAGVSAQTAYPKVEVFGGFSHLPADGNDFPRQASEGFQASAAFNLTRWFGIAGEIGGQYSTATNLWENWAGATTARSSVYEYLVAPRFTVRTRPVNLFAHGLVGMVTGHTDIGFSGSAPAFGAGGGVDVHLWSRIALRAQLDLLFSTADIVEDNTRLGVGVVVRF